MVLKTLNLILLVAAVVGSYFAIRAGREHRRLRFEHRALVAQVGSLEVLPENSDKLHVVAIPTSKPFEFAWQMYVPDKFNLKWSMKAGGGSSGSSGSSTHDGYFDLIRVRLRQGPDGGWTIWKKHRSGASLFGLSPRDAKLLEDAEKLVVEQLGRQQTAIIGADDGKTLLRLSHPDSRDDSPLLEIILGSPAAAQELRSATP